MLRTPHPACDLDEIVFGPFPRWIAETELLAEYEQVMRDWGIPPGRQPLPTMRQLSQALARSRYLDQGERAA